MTRHTDILLTALAPMIWGSTYLVTTEFLPDGYPLTVAMLRALPAGLLLMLLVRRLPRGWWIARIFVLGALNFSIFWWCLFVAAYRLPGGVAATVAAFQPLMVIFFARLALGTPIRVAAIIAALTGVAGVALLILTPAAELDMIGVIAGLGGAAAMAAGTVLTRRWQPAESLLTFTSWQMTAGGLLLVPVALAMEPALPSLSTENVLGLVYLGLIGGAITYVLFFRGIVRLEPSAVSTLGFLSPVTAVMLGWLVLDQTFTTFQQLGLVAVFAGIWMAQRAARPAAPPPAKLQESSVNAD